MGGGSCGPARRKFPQAGFRKPGLASLGIRQISNVTNAEIQVIVDALLNALNSVLWRQDFNADKRRGQRWRLKMAGRKTDGGKATESSAKGHEACLRVPRQGISLQSGCGGKQDAPSEGRHGRL